MGRRRRDTGAETRRWLGNLLLAWTFATGLAICFASAWYYRTRDLKVVIAYLGAPALIGAGLLITIGLVSLIMRTKPREPIEADGIRARKQREGIFGR